MAEVCSDIQSHPTHPSIPGVSGNDFLDFGNGNRNSSAHPQILWTGMGMKIAFPTFGNGNETLVFPGMVGNGNGNDFKKQFNL